ncbi:MAG: histidine phosphatase family protein [Actinomycetota bacterium]|nr:histidine phosphatase family protein [Actinomycetota bacterium]
MALRVDPLSTVRVHWLRHGKIASHRGNVPLTEEGISEARERGRALAEDISPGEVVHFMHAPTLRTRQTAEEIKASMEEALGSGSSVKLLEVGEQWAIRNPDIFVAGQRVELVSSVEALAEQLSAPPVDSETLADHPFFSVFLTSSDRIGYWVEHPDPPGEDTVAVARRQMAFATSLLDKQEDGPARYILATHSPVLRAILLCYLGEDPGEPEHLEPIDLTLPRNEAPELRFRDRRRSLSGTAVGEGTHSQTAWRTSK